MASTAVVLNEGELVNVVDALSLSPGDKRYIQVKESNYGVFSWEGAMPPTEDRDKKSTFTSQFEGINIDVESNPIWFWSSRGDGLLNVNVVS